MREIYVNTQVELNKAIAEYKSDEIIVCRGSQSFIIRGSSQVMAYDSSQVTAYGSSQVTAYGNSQVRACDSSQVTAYDISQVTAYDSSQVRACDISQVTACDRSQVRASKFVAVTIPINSKAKVKGGIKIKIPQIKTARQWCKFYDVPIKNGIVVLYKALNDEYKSSYKFLYTSNSTPSAPDWDGGKKECGGGLHFSPCPAMALSFYKEATKFMACPILLKEIKVHKNAEYPEKVKAPRVYKPCYEVDINGKRINSLK